jgi:hypothetical protein
MKRPPSLSDSLIYIGNHIFETKEDFLLEYKTSSVSLNTDVIENHIGNNDVGNNNSVILCVNKWCNCEIICDYTIRFITHICLIAIFETVFFFLFVSVDEDTGIMNTINFYTNNIINGCKNLTQLETLFLDDILRPFVNITRILNVGSEDLIQRRSFNNGLMILSWNYVIGLFSILCGFIGFVKWRGYKIRWVSIICENIALVSMLGLYEYMFFMTVVVKYKTETPGEISSIFVNRLQNQCNLLKN